MSFVASDGVESTHKRPAVLTTALHQFRIARQVCKSNLSPTLHIHSKETIRKNRSWKIWFQNNVNKSLFKCSPSVYLIFWRSNCRVHIPEPISCEFKRTKHPIFPTLNIIFWMAGKNIYICIHRLWCKCLWKISSFSIFSLNLFLRGQQKIC